MRVISRRTLREFWERPGCQDSEQPLKAWLRETEHADWANPADVKALYAKASIVGNDRVVFNIGGNKYRLVVRINYPHHVVYIRFIGRHSDYDKVDVETV
jgi:mRNA interferase HigB